MEFEQQIAIQAPPEHVYAELAEPRAQLGLQPLLVEVRELEGGRDVDGADVRVYDAVELLRLFGPLRWRNRIRVRMERVARDAVLRFHARSAPRIFVESVFTLSGSEDGTRVHQRFRVEAPRPLIRLVGRVAERTQGALLINLKRRVEAAAAGPR